MSETRALLAETCNRLFADLVTPELIRAAEAGDWPDELWAACEDNGLTRALVPENQGGAGLGWQDASAILFAAGYHAVPAPLAETIVVGWLLAQSGLEVPGGAMSLVPEEYALTLVGGDGAWRLSGEVDNVPWGGSAAHLLAVAKHDEDRNFVLIDEGGVSPRTDRNIGRDPRVTVRSFDATPAAVAEVPNGLSLMPIRGFGALARSVQMAGATSAVLDLCVEYAGDRVQFGRPLAKFQAIQHQLAILAEEAAAAQIAAQFGCNAVDVTPAASAAIHEIATAKIRAGEAAGKAAAIGHQVHGAIGFTDEHRLHYLTRRLWSWRSEFGAESDWAHKLGNVVTTHGAEYLWPHITSLPKE